MLATNCSPETLLVPYSTPGDVSNIIYVEAFPESE